MTTVEVVDQQGLVAVGFRIDGTWETLPKDMPEAWRALFARRLEIGTASVGAGEYLGVSIDVTNGWFQEFVGVRVGACEQAPEGMVVLSVPPNRYLKCVHPGPLRDVFRSFETLKDYGKAHGLLTSEIKIDLGYDEALSDQAHELYMAVEPARPPVHG